jgi:hypothetical protein
MASVEPEMELALSGSVVQSMVWVDISPGQERVREYTDTAVPLVPSV